jgi:hypothetical protein
VDEFRERDKEFPIYSTLRANGPHPSLTEELKDFGQFVGQWAMDVTFFDEVGAVVYHEPGEWSFAWVLDGRAIQDVLTYPRVDESGTVLGIGTTLRYYDRRTRKWAVTWNGVVTGITVVLSGGRVGDELRLEGLDPDGKICRWVFTEITTDRFVWSGYESSDVGASWRLEQRMVGIRKNDFGIAGSSVDNL